MSNQLMSSSSIVKTKMRGKDSASLPTWIVYVIFGCLGVVFALSFIAVADEPKEKENVDSFIAKNAYEHVRYLANDVGPRVVGTAANEILAVNYIKGQVNLIAETKNDDIDIEISHETFSSNNYVRGSRLELYRGIQNIVVKVSRKDVDPSTKYILMNSHVDTVIAAPGAGDDGSMVAVMLELIRVFSRKNDTTHPLVFLFNGSEEYMLAGSHGFIHFHKWMPHVGMVVNLEAAGPGAKDIMFQVREMHPWIMRAYKKVPHPFTTSLAEEIWNSGIIPSDTDFSNFKQYLDQIPGVDIAFSGNRRYYHTHLDDMDSITLGSLQHSGDNLVTFLKELDKMHEIDDYLNYVDKDTSYVFYDYLGVFFAFYNQIIATVINSIAFVLITIGICYSSFLIKKDRGVSITVLCIEYCIAVAIQVLSVILAFLIIWFIGWSLDACGRSLTWFTNSWLVFGLYICPFFFTMAILPYLYIRFREKKEVLTTSQYVQLSLHAHCILLSILLIWMTSSNVNSAFLILLSTGFYFISCVVNVCFKLTKEGNLWIYAHCCGQIFPCLYYFYMYILFIEVVIADTAYMDGSLNPEINVLFVTGAFMVMTLGFYAPVLMVFKNRIIILGSILGVFVLFLILAMTPLGFPFTKGAPQRFTTWHAKREFFNYKDELVESDSGYYIHSYDRYGAELLFDEMPIFENAFIPTKDCEERIFCGQPWQRLGYRWNQKYNYWIPAEEPLLDKPYPSVQLHDIKEAGGQKEFHLSFAGPAQMNLQIIPVDGAHLVGSTFGSSLMRQSVWKGRPAYFISYVHGVNFYYEKFYFTLTFETDSNWTEDYTFDIALSASFLETPHAITNNFSDFVKSFPDRTTVQAFPSYYGGYQF